MYEDKITLKLDKSSLYPEYEYRVADYPKIVLSEVLGTEPISAPVLNYYTCIDIQFSEKVYPDRPGKEIMDIKAVLVPNDYTIARVFKPIGTRRVMYDLNNSKFIPSVETILKKMIT